MLKDFWLQVEERDNLGLFFRVVLLVIVPPLLVLAAAVYSGQIPLDLIF